MRPRLAAIHAESRAEFDLPAEPPRHPNGVQCTLCSNACVIGEGECGFCGLRTVRQGRLIHLAGTPARGLLHWYRDPLPTNCVADWVCEGHEHPGYHNLAVFYQSCTANCLFCQNWHFRRVSPARSETINAAELASAANARTFCVCFFGGPGLTDAARPGGIQATGATRGARVLGDERYDAPQTARCGRQVCRR